MGQITEPESDIEMYTGSETEVIQPDKTTPASVEIEQRCQTLFHPIHKITSCELETFLLKSYVSLEITNN